MAFPRPDGHHIITPAASVHNAKEVIAFIESAFGGSLIERLDAPDGSIAHAEVKIGDSVMMLGEPMPNDHPMPAVLSLYVDDEEDVDRTYEQALAAGATSLSGPANQFYGYRSATVQDAGRNRWTICTVVEQLTEEEIVQRMAAMSSES